MTPEEMNNALESFREQGFTGIQRMFAVSLILEAVHKEREACAKVCESLFDMDDESCNEAEQCAKAIRARGQA